MRSKYPFFRTIAILISSMLTLLTLLANADQGIQIVTQDTPDKSKQENKFDYDYSDQLNQHIVEGRKKWKSMLIEEISILAKKAELSDKQVGQLNLIADAAVAKWMSEWKSTYYYDAVKRGHLENKNPNNHHQVKYLFSAFSYDRSEKNLKFWEGSKNQVLTPDQKQKLVEIEVERSKYRADVLVETMIFMVDEVCQLSAQKRGELRSVFKEKSDQYLEAVNHFLNKTPSFHLVGSFFLKGIDDSKIKKILSLKEYENWTVLRNAIEQKSWDKVQNWRNQK